MTVELNSQRYLGVSKGRMELCRFSDLHNALTVFRLSLHTYEGSQAEFSSRENPSGFHASARITESYIELQGL